MEGLSSVKSFGYYENDSDRFGHGDRDGDDRDDQGDLPPGTARLLRGMNLAVRGILTVTEGTMQKQMEHPARQMGTALCPWSHLL